MAGILFMLNLFINYSTKAIPAPTKIKIEVSKIATVCFCNGHLATNIKMKLKEKNYFCARKQQITGRKQKIACC